VFLFPYHRVSFVEIPPQALAGTEFSDSEPLPENALVPVGAAAAGPSPADDDDLEIDEDFLRRIREV
jgi:hypothetical protein